MIGEAKETQTTNETDTTPQGSVIGSLNGGVTLTAGNRVHITGSDVISNTSTAIVGNDVTLDAALGTQDTTQSYKQQQAGITLGLGGGLASATQSVYGHSQAANHAEDDRLKALYASQAAYTAYEAYNAYQDAAGAAASADTNVSQGISLRIGLGASSASSSTTTHDETAYGSHIQSNNVALAAANNLNILSQQENHGQEVFKGFARRNATMPQLVPVSIGVHHFEHVLGQINRQFARFDNRSTLIYGLALALYRSVDSFTLLRWPLWPDRSGASPCDYEFSPAAIGADGFFWLSPLKAL
ncbi:hypothetical protein EO087_07825 [Dyella sp. M7H15-1]|uniref:hemagglutinin repeat-containing protein n=1 Tax=Dyella sp. M7H15-1 TaxID=2501295 RepID=UPI00100521DD|nr:hemagglutinin repeat-containing protein [Dyella sp. M7H15-1]QAU23908.1 hypothetical protein EO087_07825 [Dyella sp. M7H15-1]